MLAVLALSRHVEHKIQGGARHSVGLPVRGASGLWVSAPSDKFCVPGQSTDQKGGQAGGLRTLYRKTVGRNFRHLARQRNGLFLGMFISFSVFQPHAYLTVATLKSFRGAPCVLLFVAVVQYLFNMSNREMSY